MTAVAPSARLGDDDPQYRPFLGGIASGFAAATARAKVLFSVDTYGLWDLYLASFPESERQIYNCSACRHFVQRYGGLVTIDSNGERLSSVWLAQYVPSGFMDRVKMLSDEVSRRPVVRAFLAAPGVLGSPETGAWSHLAVTVPAHLRSGDRLRTPGQVAAAIRENVATVARALDEFPIEALREALRVLDADALSRSEKFVGPVQWLLDLQTARAATKDERRRSALLWRAVATAPEGYSHPRASVIGPLLEGIIAGKSYETIRSEFAAMLHPLRYQRPTAPPSSGNIAEAERIVARLGIARSLERRFARLEDCQTIWTPAPAKPDAPSGGVFAHLQAKDETAAVPSVKLPTQTMTWEKFARTVLPMAERMEFHVPSHGNFEALVTATHADAPPIIRWDRDDARNPVTTYVYRGGSPAERWNLRGGAWRAVTGVVLQPNLWGDQPQPQPQHGVGLVLVIDGARDVKAAELALFPETLRDDLRGIRATIEAFSKAGSISGSENASACGYGIGKGHCGITLRVTVAGSSSEYRIDRWD